MQLMVTEVNILTTAFPAADLRPMAGQNELAAAEAVASPGNRPEKVTRVLNAVYETIAGQPVTLDVVRQLPSGTREWLLQQAGIHFRPDLVWFEASCTHCGHPYDLSLKLNNAARHQPAKMRLEIVVETSLGSRSFMLPNGAHEEAFARSDHVDDPRRTFAALCGLSEQAEDEALQFDVHDLALIDEAFGEACPDISDETSSVCPSCGKQTSARIDPLLFAFPHEATILQETHLIASAYGWPHDQILGLSVRHRSLFATKIAQDYRQSGSASSWRSA